MREKEKQSMRERKKESMREREREREKQGNEKRSVRPITTILDKTNIYIFLISFKYYYIFGDKKIMMVCLFVSNEDLVLVFTI